MVKKKNQRNLVKHNVEAAYTRAKEIGVDMLIVGDSLLLDFLQHEEFCACPPVFSWCCELVAKMRSDNPAEFGTAIFAGVFRDIIIVRLAPAAPEVDGMEALAG